MWPPAEVRAVRRKLSEALTYVTKKQKAYSTVQKPVHALPRAGQKNIGCVAGLGDHFGGGGLGEPVTVTLARLLAPSCV